MERLFGVSRTMTYVIIGVSLIFIVGILSNMGAKAVKGKTYYQIVSPNGEYHLTDSYKMTGSCIFFTDEFDNENIVCGSFRIKKI